MEHIKITLGDRDKYPMRFTVMFEITDVQAREILDSRGNPTIEVEIFAGEYMGRASVPSGASTGKREAVELRDGGDRYHGKGVKKAIENIERHIAPRLIGMDVMQQRKIDLMLISLDGTPNKSKLGANATLGVSLASARLASYLMEMPLYRYLGGTNARVLPVPFMNVINGGAHAGNELSIQEHMIAPVGAKNVREAVRMGSEVYHQLKSVLKKKYGPDATNVGDEGGFAPPMKHIEEPFEAITQAIDEMGYSDSVKIALDSAASNFFRDGKYIVQGKEMDAGELLDIYEELISKYPIILLEDPFAEDDWDAFVEITAKLGNRVQIVGDDIFVTNPNLISEGIERKAANAALIKLNQIGTVTETIEAVRMAQNAGWKTMVSHRSGETADDFIADFAVAMNAGQIKSGAPCRVDRVEKYNQLMRIEEELRETAEYGY